MARLLFPLLGFAALGHASTLMTDFSGNGLPLRWFSVNDNVMGGRSLGSFEVSEGRLLFSGSLNTNGGGFASIRTQALDLKLGRAEGIHLTLRGDGRLYTMMLRQEGDRGISYRARFSTTRGETEEVWLPLRSFRPMWRGRELDRPPLDPGRIESLGFMIADKIDGAFRLEVDAVRSYGAFAIADLQWKARPLVIFAPVAGSEPLRTQLEAVRESAAELRERNVVVIVVTNDGKARAGRRPLSGGEVEALQQRFGIAPDAFAVRLVGKDGGVKRSGAEPFALDEVLKQIDSMPMRRAESASRQDHRD